VITKDPLKPPSPEELDKQGFSFPELPRITCEQLKDMIDNKESLILIDTRVTLIYDMGNIPQSINIPIDMEEIDLFDRLLMLPKDKPVIVYCD
jgi:rhodanese-related sulfurtransferase